MIYPMVVIGLTAAVIVMVMMVLSFPFVRHRHDWRVVGSSVVDCEDYVDGALVHGSTKTVVLMRCVQPGCREPVSSKEFKGEFRVPPDPLSREPDA